MDGQVRERTITQRRVFDGRLLHVRVDDVVLADGRQTVREVIEHPGSVAILAIDEAGRLIMVRQWRHAVQQALLEIPAGTVETGETLEAAARRELLEETGYVVQEIVEIVDFFPTAGYSDERMHLFLATGCSPIGHPATDDEWITVEVIEASDLPSRIAAGGGEVRDAKSLIVICWWLWRQSEDRLNGG